MAHLKKYGRGGHFWVPLLFCLLLPITWAQASDEQPEASAGAQAEIPSIHPITLDADGRVLVDVEVAGQGPFPFLLDTAASRTVLYRTFVSLLGLEAVPFRSARVMTATGRKEMQLYRVGTFQALGRALDVDETVAMPDPANGDQYGILGVDIMRGRKLLIEARGAQLLGHDDDLPEGTWLRIQGRPVGPRGGRSVAVMVRVGSLEIPAILDTGAGLTVLNGAALDALRESSSEDIQTEGASLSAAGGTVPARMVNLPPISVGDWQLPAKRVAVAQLPVFAMSGAARVPAMILGADMLLEAPGLVIDFARWSLYVRQE